MYSESDIAQAVEAGVLSPEAAAAFRDHVAAGRSAPAVDEEHFRLLSGFNDIFVAIAATLMLVAAARIGALMGTLPGAGGDTPQQVGLAFTGGGLAVAALAWLLAEYFTRKRRMALPSILLLLAFVGGTFIGLSGIGVMNGENLKVALDVSGEVEERQLAASIAAIVALLTSIAAWLHWKRFVVPITVAAGAAALVAVVVALILGFVPGADRWLNPLLLVAGVLVFLLAMRWDMSDLERRTRRSDVAFWLHLAAAPLIAHPVFHMLGVFDGAIPVGMALLVVALYVAFAFVALAVDRRALLVSSLIYVLYAMYTLFNQSGAVELSAALTALVIGSALLTLSAFWQPMRRGVVSLLGGLDARLPPVHRPEYA
ncbi:hypothetical protein [Sphingosinithalassobacter sp. CS137]|uniref:hypothetical protein n=1 Tax=Sphingosinithalassobacter sp. CS137 TaxID=2762748 RepID=UPI00165DB7F6|nr:hypothetical protein [Sphingosinithalassobacter sp. CS137]